MSVYRKPNRKKWPARRLFLLAAVLLLAVGALATWRVGQAPTLTIDPQRPAIGRATEIRFGVGAAGRGLSEAKVFVVQDGRRHEVAAREYRYRPSWAFWGERTTADELVVEIGSDTVAALREGNATVQLEASSPGTWLRDPRTTAAEVGMAVQLRPPLISVASTQHYPAQGGCEVVVYRVGATAVRHGVRVGEEWFPGHDLPGSTDGLRFALFAVPFDQSDVAAIRLEAEDIVGNRAETGFVDKFFPRSYSTDRIEVSERFMSKVVPEILSQTPSLRDRGSLLENYVAINRDLRAENAKTLRDLAAASAERFLWSDGFLSMPNAQVMSSFADRRTYFHQGEEIDHQDHLGFDLASVRQAPVPAVNAGTVVLARYFGIYGNAVVVDHGFGLMSLYGHLSSIAVTEGQSVARGAQLGRTGETGLAAGDHLHFTMLLGGTAVNPIEWWDAKWIRDRLRRKLGNGMPFTG